MKAPTYISVSGRTASRAPGFTLLEIVVTIALIGVITSVAVFNMGSSMSVRTSRTKLISDAAHLNQMVALYLADGGSLDGVTTEQGVLDKLKRSRPSGESKTNVAISTGRFIDVRLRAELDSNASDYHVVWNTTTKRFDILTSSSSGVNNFYLDDTLSESSFPMDNRTTSSVKFNGSNGWIWGTAASEPGITYVSPSTVNQVNQNNGFNPLTSLPSSTTGSGSGSSGSGSGPGPGVGTGTGTGSSGSGSPATALPMPSLSPGGGTFSAGAFPSSVSINSGGAPGGVNSKLVYRKNGGGWQDYTASISLSSGDRVEAMNLALTALYTDSPIAAGEYYSLVSGFTGSSAGSWANVTGGSTLQYNITPGTPTTTVSHGNTQLDLGNGDFLDAGVPNVLTYTKNDFTSVQANTSFKLGDLTMLNGTTFYNSEASSVTLRVNLNLSSPPLNTTVDIVFNLINTSNSTDRLASADIVQIATPQPTSFTVNGVTYSLQLSWVTLDPGAGVVQGDQFLVFEGASARAELRATLVSNH